MPKRVFTTPNKARNTLEYNRSCGRLPSRPQFKRAFGWRYDKRGTGKPTTSRYAIWSSMILQLGPFDRPFIDSTFFNCVGDEVSQWEREAILVHHTNNRSQILDQRVGAFSKVVNQKRRFNGTRQKFSAFNSKIEYVHNPSKL